MAEATTASSFEMDGFVVSSYLSVLGMLMDREEDVQELRRRGILCGHFSNAQTLSFSKVLVQHLRLGFNYFTIVQGIEAYIRTRPAGEDRCPQVPLQQFQARRRCSFHCQRARRHLQDTLFSKEIREMPSFLKIPRVLKQPAN